MAPVSEIKLIRTDTTLDLSQKAEKVCSQKRLAKLKISSFGDKVVELPKKKCSVSGLGE